MNTQQFKNELNKLTKKELIDRILISARVAERAIAKYAKFPDIVNPEKKALEYLADWTDKEIWERVD